MISKRNHPSTQGVNKGTTNQKRKLQESKKSKKEGKDLFCKANNQSNKVLKKKSFRPGIDLSISSKQLFLSFQRHHIKRHEERWTIYNHFDDDQSCLANTLTAPKQYEASPKILQINPKP